MMHRLVPTLLPLAAAIAVHRRPTTTFAAAFSTKPSAAPRSKFSDIHPPRRSEADEALRRMQRRHRPVASSFAPARFDPHPLLTNRHLQTIAGVFLRKDPDCAYVSGGGAAGAGRVLAALANAEPSGGECAFWDERRRVTTSCERDFYSVDVRYAGERRAPYQSEGGKGTVVLVHGLESNSNTSLSTDLGRAYWERGYDVACINFRGCCGTPNDTIGGYHLGFTDDLRHFLKLMSDLREGSDGFDDRPIYLSGFSLGANVVVKCLGELGDAALSLYNVRGAAVCGAPFDAERNIQFLDAPGFNRAVYGTKFLKTMKERARQQLDAFCDGDPSTELFDYGGVMGATSVAEFDEHYIARIYGFEDNVDYYRQASCYYYLPGVAVPLYILNSGDDPFFDPEFFPVEESVDGGGMAPVKMERTEHGGHLGYMFHQMTGNEKDGTKPSTSWMPMELSRFIDHVHNSEEMSEKASWFSSVFYIN